MTTNKCGLSRVLRDRELFVELFPKCFAPKRSRVQKTALKMHIDRDLFDRLEQLGHPMGRGRIRRALRNYCNGPKYAQAIARGGERTDLYGNPSGEIAPEAQANAQAALEKFDPPGERRYAINVRVLAEADELARAA